jgi:hypothetical protein
MQCNNDIACKGVTYYVNDDDYESLYVDCRLNSAVCSGAEIYCDYSSADDFNGLTIWEDNDWTCTGDYDCW